MLQLLVTLAPAAPSIAHGRTLPTRPSPAAVAAAQQVLARAGAGAGAGGAAGLVGPGADLPAPRRRATLSVIINLEAVFSLLVPLLLLSVKLAFLLWLFGRNASPSKRFALGVMAVLWVLFEGWGILRRRQAQGRERERAERERRRAVRAQVRAQGAGAGAPVPAQGAAGGPVAPAAIAAAGGGAPPAHPADAPRPARATRRRQPASRLTPKYWLNTLAAVGLVAEARELGLQPRYIAGRPVSPPSPRPPGRVHRALRTVAVALVLFFATLSPEVERKRRRALDKRERLLAERRARDGRDRVARAQQLLRVQQGALHRAPSGVEVALTSEDESRAGSRAATPAPGPGAAAVAGREGRSGGAREGEAQQAQESTPEEGSAGERLEMDAAGLRRRRMAALALRARRTAGAGQGGGDADAAGDGAAAGRARVPDAELFRDGGSDAYASPRAGAMGPALGQEPVARPEAPLPPPVAAAAAPAVPVLAPVAGDVAEVDPEEEDVASASGDGASTSGDEGVGGDGDGAAARRIRPAPREGDEVDEVVALF